MEFIIRKIISIDKDAENYRSGIDDLIREKQNILQEKLNKMQEEWMEDQKNIKESIAKEKLKRAESDAEAIIQEKEVQLDCLKNKYEENKQQIIDGIFEKIINSL